MKFAMLMFMLFTNLATAKLLEINPDHSKVFFEIDYMKLTTVTGQFKTYEGNFKMTNSEKSISDIIVSIKSDSLDTSNPKRDLHMKGHDFFFSSKYPTVDFRIPGISFISVGKKVKLRGDLTIRGIKKAVTLDCIYKGKMIDPWKKENYFFEITGVINRQNFGFNWNKEFDRGGYLVGDNVRINISIQAQVAGERTASSTHMTPNINRHLKKSTTP